MLKIILWSVGGLIALCVAGAVAYAAYVELTTKEPPFTVVKRDGDFEIRDYPALVVATVDAAGARRDAANDGFRVIARYIFGANRATTEIAMTAPVLQQPAEGVSIAMTAPVLQQGTGPRGDDWRISFVMPEEWTLDALPAPVDAVVELEQVPARRLAVIRFSGVADDSRIAEMSAALQAWLDREGAAPLGAPTYAYYNAPWIPGFLRRNEVMVEIAPQR
ncbi:MAG: heme-binding protein [Alphaproteobacteria bacterium]